MRYTVAELKGLMPEVNTTMAKKAAVKTEAAVETPARKVKTKQAETATPPETRQYTKHIPEGFVSLSQLCERLGVPPLKARLKLRKEGIEPGDNRRYLWKEGSEDLQKVTSLIQPAA